MNSEAELSRGKNTGEINWLFCNFVSPNLGREKIGPVNDAELRGNIK